MFVHVVFMTFRESSDIAQAKKKLEALKESVPSIIDLEVGIDIVHSARSKDLVLITRFQNENEYRKYATDPNHYVVLQWLKSVLIESSTVDYIQAAP